MNSAPYPYDRWPRLSRAQAASLRAVQSLWPALDTATGLSTARRLLGAPCDARVGLPEPSRPEHAQRCAGLVLDDDSHSRGTTVLLIPNAFAKGLADRVLGGDGMEVHDGSNMDAWGAGALAYLMARVLAALQGPLSLREVLHNPSEQLAAHVTRAIRLPLMITVGESKAWCSLWLADHVSPAVPAYPLVFRSWLAHLPITLLAEAGHAILPRQEVENLGLDDVLIPEGCLLRAASSGFEGPVMLRFAGGYQGCIEAHARDSSLHYVQPKLFEEAPMSDQRSHSADPLAEVVSLGSDAHVQVTVELARFTLPLGEIAALKSGDIFSTRTPIGAQVTLRANGVAVATGELVDIEGETGVRVLEVK